MVLKYAAMDNFVYNHVGLFVVDNDNSTNKLTDKNKRKGIVKLWVYAYLEN